MKPENAAFYADVLGALQANSMALFAGAGLSKAAGFVDWKGLLREIAKDLGLDVDKESDLISIAQYNVNKVGGRSMLNQAIIEKFNEDVDLTENHRILCRLPISTYWTTNYDGLIEKGLENAKRIADVKHTVTQLNWSKPRRDAVVYKMHGDQTLPNEAVLTKDDYENYFVDKSSFVNALSGDLVSKLFLFVGFSFTDPNLDYILSRVRIQMRNAQHHHYYFIKRITLGDLGVSTSEEFQYQKAKQEHFISDLKRSKLLPIYVDTYPEITDILREIENIFKRQTVFISGSAEEYGIWDKNKALSFIHKLSGRLIREGYRVVNGFGWGVGSAVINGALEEIYKHPNRFSTDLLIVRPFPQFASGDKTLQELWRIYRKEMMKMAGIAIYVFGNKLNSDNLTERKIISSSGVKEEYDIGNDLKLIQIPVKGTGYVSAELADQLRENQQKTNSETTLLELYGSLYTQTDPDKIIESIISILKEVKK